MLFVRGRCFVVRGYAVSRRYINVCNCDMFSVVYVYLDHLKFCVVRIDGRRYVCCGEWNVVSNECNGPTSCLVQSIGLHCCEVMYFGCVCKGTVSTADVVKVVLTNIPLCASNFYVMEPEGVIHLIAPKDVQNSSNDWYKQREQLSLLSQNWNH